MSNIEAGYKLYRLFATGLCSTHIFAAEAVLQSKVIE